MLWNLQTLQQEAFRLPFNRRSLRILQPSKQTLPVQVFPLKECETCEHAKEKRCQGGCIGFAEAKWEELGKSM